MELYLILGLVGVFLIHYFVYIHFMRKKFDSLQDSVHYLYGENERMMNEMEGIRKELDGVEKVQDLLNSQWVLTSSSEWGDEVGESYNE